MTRTQDPEARLEVLLPPSAEDMNFPDDVPEINRGIFYIYFSIQTVLNYTFFGWLNLDSFPFNKLYAR